MHKRVLIGLAGLVLALPLFGCQSPQPAKEPPQPTKELPQPAVPAKPIEPTPVAPNPLPASHDPTHLAASDPRAYLQFSLSKCEQLESYSLLFVRQERRGLFKSLQPPERIQTWFRRSPFSVRMKWLDPGIKYGESTYVAGQNDGRVLFVPNDTPLNLPQRIYRVSPATPVTWGECRYPVTEFGVELLLKTTLQTLADDPGARLSYAGMVQPPGEERTAHCIRIDYSPAKHPAPLQKLYFDPQSHLPVRTDMLFANETIDTVYAYHDLRSDAPLGDDDFVLEYERARAAQATAGSNP